MLVVIQWDQILVCVWCGDWENEVNESIIDRRKFHEPFSFVCRDVRVYDFDDSNSQC